MLGDMTSWRQHVSMQSSINDVYDSSIINIYYF